MLWFFFPTVLSSVLPLTWFPKVGKFKNIDADAVKKLFLLLIDDARANQGLMIPDGPVYVEKHPCFDQLGHIPC